VTETPPGWYPDPNDATGQRWWDGTTWTAHSVRLQPGTSLSTSGAAPSRGPLVAVIVGVVALLVIIAVGVFAFGGLVSSHTSTTATTPAPLAAATTPSPTPTPTKAPVPGRLVSAKGVSLVLPRGWTNVPTSPGDLTKFLNRVAPKGPTARAAWKTAAAQVKGHSFLLFAIGPVDKKRKFADNVNVLAFPSSGTDLATLGAQLPAQLSQIGAKNVVEKRIKVGGHEVLRVTLTLHLKTAAGPEIVTHEVQYYLLGTQDVVVTVALSPAEAYSHADVIGQTIRVK
jgi:Protein of unknown function (DUF2510)